MLSASAKLLDHLGLSYHASLVQGAITKTINEDHVHTPGEYYLNIYEKKILLDWSYEKIDLFEQIWEEWLLVSMSFRISSATFRKRPKFKTGKLSIELLYGESLDL